MGLFSTNEEKQAKEQGKINQFIAEYELNDLTPKDYKLLKQILTNMNLGAMNGAVASFGNAETRAQLMFSQAQVNQNWMIIKQLSRISAQLETIASK